MGEAHGIAASWPAGRDDPQAAAGRASISAECTDVGRLSVLDRVVSLTLRSTKR